jgi:hypothetical protein
MASVVRLSAGWASSSAASRQDVPEQEGHDDDRRGDSDDRYGRGSHDHAALISLLPVAETLSGERYDPSAVINLMPPQLDR